MGLPSPAVARQPLHRRAIDIEAFERADGLFDLEARLVRRCHAYARDGDVVRRHYPQWFESSQSRPTP
jgi:hypothetical protein